MKSILKEKISLINKTPGLAGVEVFKVLYYEQLQVKHLQYKYN